MAKITALTVQKKNPNRVNLFLDGKFAFGLATAVALPLEVGQTVTPAQIAQLQQQDSFEKARETAVSFLSYRPRSAQEVRLNLHKKGIDSDIIDQVIRRLEEVDLINDLNFANYWVEQRETFKPRGVLALRQELMQKGVSSSIIDQATADVDETAAAVRAAAKVASRWATYEEEQFRRKLSQYLQRRGFPYSLIRQIVADRWESLSETRQQGE